VTLTKALLQCASALALLSANAALAQEATPKAAAAPNASPKAAAAPDASAPSDTVETVVVTAQKREQNLQNVPESVTAITANAMHTAGVTDMKGVALLTPSLSVSQTVGPVNQSYRIRGMGSDANIPTFEPDVALFVDGVYMPRSGLSVDDLVNVDRVEVLEGPQSTLYGKNATAGVVNVVTAAPSSYLKGSLEGSVSELDSSLKAPVYRVAGSVSGPITDRLRVSLTGVSYNQGDSYKNLQPGAPNANNMNRYALRAVADADLWSGATLRVALSRSEIYNTRNGDADNLYYVTSPPNNAFKLDSLLGPKFNVPVCPDNNPNNRVICTSSPWTNASYNDVASATFTAPVGRLNFTSITALSDYRVKDANGDIAQVILPLLSYDDIQKGGDFSQELRLASPTGDKLEWMIGGFYEHSNFSRGDDGRTPTFVVGAAGPFVPLPAPLGAFKVGQPGDQGFLNSNSNSNYGAIFGNLTYHFTDRFSLSGGVREQVESKRASVDNFYSISPSTPKLPLPCGPFPVNLLTVSLTPTASPTCPSTAVNADFSHSTSYPTWNVTGQYHATAQTMLYATVSRGGKSFGYNIGFGNTPSSQRQFTDEFVTDYEVGVKSTLLGGRARVSAALFYSDVDNYQNATFVGTQFLVNNAEKVTVQGAQANGTMVLGHGFTVNAAATYVDAVYKTYTAGGCYYGEPANNGAGGCNLSGRGLPLSPRWRTNAGLQYQHDTGLGQFYGRLDWTWQSSMYANTNLDPRSVQAAYSLVNLRAGLKLGHGLDVALWSNNVTNTVFSQADYVSNLFGINDPAFQRFLGRPREFGLNVKKTF
jgi:outer membrane receptor protein involved in Fe transport